MTTTTSEIIVEEMPITLKLPPITAGSDYQFSLQILDDNDNPQNTTGWSMEIKGREMDASGSQLFDLTVGSGIVHTASVGKFDVTISRTVSVTLNIPYVAWDCKVTDASGNVTFPFEGVIKVRQPVTR